MVKEELDLTSIAYDNLLQIFNPNEIYVKGRNGINNIVLLMNLF